MGRQAQEDINKLNEDQRNAFNAIINAIDGQGDKHLFFIDGPGGTGKSFLYNALIGLIRGERRKSVIVVASSGIAALLLTGGMTAHSVFKIPIPIFSDSV